MIRISPKIAVTTFDLDQVARMTVEVCADRFDRALLNPQRHVVVPARYGRVMKLTGRDTTSGLWICLDKRDGPFLASRIADVYMCERVSQLVLFRTRVRFPWEHGLAMPLAIVEPLANEVLARLIEPELEELLVDLSDPSGHVH